ncbi:hypothetical protein SDC9_191660 [bioreactor metagenome]|uniref:Uncharacterized protein n=1 Tax=bioreactor metagenome TaxID=1076179 RepID=A0A645I0Y0_9ZZZZ
MITILTVYTLQMESHTQGDLYMMLITLMI